MKKVLLSSVLIIAFVVYALEQRMQGAANIPAVGNSQNITQSTPAPTAVAAGSSGPRIGQLININGTIYLVKQDGLYGFPSMAVFTSLGYQLSDVTPANSAEAALAMVGIMSAQNIVAASPTPTAAPTAAGQYKDGSYTGSVANAFYGNLQVEAIISGGKITDVVFLQYPNDRGESVQVNSRAMPLLKSEAIAAQSAQVDIVSGATQSSGAFKQSLSDALAQAKS